MDQALYPKERYPQGHPDLAPSLNNLGYILWRQGNYGEGRKYLQRAPGDETRPCIPRSGIPRAIPVWPRA